MTKLKTEPNIITWYLPLIIWIKNAISPQLNVSQTLYRSKEIYLKNNPNEKVIKWKKFKAPDNYEECE